MAWQHILPEVNLRGFKKCCISNAVDGTDDMLKRMGMLGVMCEEGEGTDCEDGDSDNEW